MTKPTTHINWTTTLRWGGTLISTLLFLWLILRQNWEVVLAKAGGIAFWAFFLALACYLLSYFFNTLRWCLLLWAQEVKIPFWKAYQLTWAGNFASNFLPSTIGGDGFRMLAVHAYTKSKSLSIGSVALDRIINMAAMACLIPAPLLIFGETLMSSLAPPAHPALGVRAGQVAGVRGVGFDCAPLRSALILPFGLQKLFEKYFPKVVSAFQLWAAKPWAFIYAFLAAWPSNLFPMAATWLLARQLGMDVSFWQVLGVQTVTYFLSVLPISVNGYGLREVAYTTLYSALGATLEQASTLALVTRFLTVLSTVPGAIWLSSAVTGVIPFEEAS